MTTVLGLLESTTKEEFNQWLQEKYYKLDLNTLQSMGVKVPTVDELWEYRNQTIKGLKKLHKGKA